MGLHRTTADEDMGYLWICSVLCILSLTNQGSDE